MISKPAPLLTSTGRSPMILTIKRVFLEINLIFSIHLIQLKAGLTFDMSFILILTQKSFVLLHVEQVQIVLALDLLSNHEEMWNRSRMEKGQTLLALLWKIGKFCTVQLGWIKHKLKKLMIVTVVLQKIFCDNDVQ